ncbi:MAG: hypothetical protein AB9866_14720 [Syntrophobacteraceae bacterium]
MSAGTGPVYPPAPLRAYIVESIEELDRYKWSGHRALIDNVKLPWMDSDHVLLQFGSTRRMGLIAYRAFMQEGVGLGISRS